MGELFGTLDEAGFDRVLAVLEAPGRWPPLFRSRRGRNTIDLSASEITLKTPAHRVVLTLVLLLAVKDRATDLHFEPWRPPDDEGQIGLRMSDRVDGELLELVPPPAFLKDYLGRDLEGVAGLGSPRRRLAGLLRRLASRIDGQPLPHRLGGFRLGLPGESIEVELAAHSSVLGDRFFLHFSPISDAASEGAHSVLKRIDRERRT